MPQAAGVPIKSSRSPFFRCWFSRGLRSRFGASLVETVAAIGLLTVAMTILGQFMFEAIQGSVVARRRVQCILLAQEQMEDIIANRADLAAWQTRAERDNPIDAEAKHRQFADEEFNSYRWDWDIADREGAPGMKQVTVRAYWESPYGAQPWVEYKLTTLLVVPERN